MRTGAHIRYLILFPLVLGPLSIIFIDVIMGLASFEAALEALASPLQLITFVATAIPGLLLLWLVSHRTRLAGTTTPLQAFGFMRRLPFLMMSWGIVHTGVFSIVLHRNAVYVNDALGMVITLIYALCVGLFFANLVYIGSLPRWESRLPIQPILNGSARTIGLNTQFFISVSLTVVAFLFGGIAVAFHALYADYDMWFALIRIGFVAVPFLLLTGLVVYFLGTLVTRPLIAALPAIREYATGNLGGRLAVESVNELAQALASINAFVEAASETLRTSQENASATVSAAQSLATEAEQQNEHASSANATITSVAARITDLNTHLQSTASATEEIARTLESLEQQLSRQNLAVESTVAGAEELSASTSNVVDVSQRRQTAAQQLATTTAEGRTRTEGAVRNMASIADQVGDLQKLNSVIAALAAQTNMLAMNAAIEAAHAGDAGRGFAVVAGEIRNLAASATASARDSSTFLKEVVAGIHQTDEAIRAVHDSFEAIDREGESVVGSLGEIVAAAREMNQTAQDIRTQMVDLQRVNEEVLAGAGEIRNGVAEINSADQQSMQIGETIASSTQDVSERINDLVRSADQVREITLRLDRDAEAVIAALSQFRMDENGILVSAIVE